MDWVKVDCGLNKLPSRLTFHSLPRSRLWGTRITSYLFLFPFFLIDKCINRYLCKAVMRHSSTKTRLSNTISHERQCFYKLPYFSVYQFQIKKNLFTVKDHVPRELRSRVVYKNFFLCMLLSLLHRRKLSTFFYTRPWTLLFWQILSHYQTFTKLETLPQNPVLQNTLKS